MNHPPGTVLVPCHDLARYHQFSNDLTLLDVPDGTKISFMRSSSIVQNLNMGVETMLGDEESQWLWLIGDDHAFNRDIVKKLLDRNLDIVAPLCTKRGPPFPLVAYPDTIGTDVHGRTLYDTLTYDELDGDEPFSVAASGSAGMLIRRHVLEVMDPPWFRNSDGLTTNEDVEFCKAARHAGFTVWVDPTVWLGHIGIVVAWPSKRAGIWGLTLDFQGSGTNQVFVAGGIQPDEDGKAVEHGELTPAV